MRRVVVESPYAGKNLDEIEINEHYARACLHDCFKRGEAPFCSHLLYTQQGVLRDNVPEERTLGINAGFHWGDLAAARVVYTDRGVTSGMRLGIERSESMGQPIEYRTLPDWVRSLR